MALANTVQDLITKGFQAVGITQEGGTPTADQLASGLLIYNTMIKAWSAYGIDTWARADGVITCTSGTTTYTVGPSGDVNMARPLRIMNAYRTNTNGTSTPLEELTKQEYMWLSDKDQEGVTTQYYFDQEDPQGNFLVWPVPGTSDLPLTITFDARIPVVESALIDEPTLPDYWQEPLIYNIAVRLGIRGGRPISPDLRKLADESLKLARDAEYEQGSIYLQPDYQYGYWKTN